MLDMLLYSYLIGVAVEIVLAQLIQMSVARSHRRYVIMSALIATVLAEMVLTGVGAWLVFSQQQYGLYAALGLNVVAQSAFLWVAFHRNDDDWFSDQFKSAIKKLKRLASSQKRRKVSARAIITRP